MPQMIQAKTKDVRLFSAIVAMGIPWEMEAGSVAGGERAWLFGDVSDCGKWKLPELLSWWRDSTFHTKNPRHPFNVVKSCMGSDKGLRAAVKDHCGFRQRKVGDSFTIDAIGMEGDRDFSPRSTPDIAFAAALSSVGFEVTEGPSIGQQRIFAISERSVSMGYTHAEAMHWWNDAKFTENNNQHPFAYAKAVAITYRAAVDAIKRERPLVKWSPPGSIGFAYIHPDCSTKTEEKVGGWLKGK